MLQKQSPEVFCKKGVLKNFGISQLYWSLFLRTLILNNLYERLLLNASHVISLKNCNGFNFEVETAYKTIFFAKSVYQNTSN